VDIVSELDWAEARGATSVLAVPIHVAGELRALLAVANVVRCSGDLPSLKVPLVGFSARDEALLLLLASMYSHRLAQHLLRIREHGRLHELTGRFRRQSHLMAIEQSLSHEVHLQPFCKQLVAAFVQLLGCSWAALYVPSVDGESGGCVCQRFSMEAGGNVDVADGFGASRLLENMQGLGSAVRSANGEELDELVDSAELPRSVGVVRSFLIQPLHEVSSRSRCLAVLLAINKQAEETSFSLDDGTIAATLAEVSSACFHCPIVRREAACAGVGDPSQQATLVPPYTVLC
jgi:hypothetical protein